MGLDMRSEAVRDLNPYSTFLSGGIEDSFENLLRYNNVDINCNGETDNYITRLNEDNLNSIAKTWIVSKFGILNGDGVVNLESQYIDSNDTIMTDRPHITIDILGKNYPGEPKDFYSIIRGLDEPNSKELAYEIGAKSTNKGFITFGQNNNIVDYDLYKIVVDKKGILTLNVLQNSFTGVNKISLTDNNNEIVLSNSELTETYEYDVTPGDYYVQIRGFANEESYKNPYTLVTNFEAALTASMLVSGSKIQFYDCLIGAPKGKVITVTNTGETDFFVTGLGLSETNADQFEIINTLPFKISSKANQNVTVRFNPTGNGTKTAKLTINTDLPEISPKTVTLEGNGTDHETRVLVIDPAVSYNFGDAKLTKTKSKSITVQNTGSNAVTINSILISGSNPDRKSVV